MIIVRGVNRYPQDIEMTVERASERIQPQAVAAFAVDLAGRERLIVVAEVERTAAERLERRDRRGAQGRNRRARTAARRGHSGAFRLRSQDIERQDSAACLPRRFFERLAAGDAGVARAGGWRTRNRGRRQNWCRQRTASSGPTSAPAAGPQGDVSQTIAQIVMDHVRAIAKERAKSMTLESNIVTDLGLDSLERLQIANSLEETFGGRFPGRCAGRNRNGRRGRRRDSDLYRHRAASAAACRPPARRRGRPAARFRPNATTLPRCPSTSG